MSLGDALLVVFGSGLGGAVIGGLLVASWNGAVRREVERRRGRPIDPEARAPDIGKGAG